MIIENVEQEIWTDFKSLPESNLMESLSYSAATSHFGDIYEDRQNLVHQGLSRKLEYDEDFAINQFLLNSDFKNMDWDKLANLYPKNEKIKLSDSDIKPRIIKGKTRRTEKEREYILDWLKSEWELQRKILHGKIPNEKAAKEYLVDLRWSEGVICPRCNHHKIYYTPYNEKFKCAKCTLKFSEKAGTIFKASNLPLLTWYEAMYLLTQHNTKRISHYQLADALNISQVTAWRAAVKIQSKVQDVFIQKIISHLSTIKNEYTIQHS